ncbi:S8 family serine peptidase [Kribbella sp. NPDC026611]|uniref:S8 family serine peptidase n=1 Tax=Kribbella sp. NPDC026611 TaxID=3154911 RepID=UPI0033C51D7D
MVIQPDGVQGREVASGRWGDEEVQYLANRVVVKFRAPADVGEYGEMVAASESLAGELDGATAVREPTTTGRVVLNVSPGTDVIQLAQELSNRDDVLYAEPDVIDHAAVVPNDTRYSEQWALPKVNAPDAWDLETGKTTVVIGIVDSGISMSAADVLDHPDLNDTGRFVLGTDFVDGGTPRDLNGHGTHVAGIAAALGNNSNGVAGMNWASRVYVCRTLDVTGNGSAADFADAVEEITDYAVANGLKAVINYSGGGAASQTKLDACNYASTRGMLLCAAAGNDNGGPVIWPAAYSTTVPGVIAVGSTTSTDTVSSFSNVGPEVTVVAPGSGILSTLPTYAVTITAGLNYGLLSGTSMATPLVTGLVALMWSKNNAKTNVSIKQCLIDTAVKLGAGTFDNAWGNGRVDAAAAVRCVSPIFQPTFIPKLCDLETVIRIKCQPESRLVLCQPESRIVICWPPVTKLKVSCQVSRLPILCPVNSSVLRCPPVSLIDGCASNVPGCEIDIDPTGPIVNPPIGRQFVFVDDAGQAQVWQAPEGAETESWYGDAQYVYRADDGSMRPFQAGDGE